MAIHHQIVTFPAEQKSDFTWFSGGSSRTFTYVGGKVTIPEIESPLVLSLEDFDWVTNEVYRWIMLVNDVTGLPSITVAPRMIDFNVNSTPSSPAPSAKRHNVSMKVDVDAFGGGGALFDVVHASNVVTIKAQPEYSLGWANLVLVNNLFREVAYAANNGHRPPVDWEMS